MLTSACARSHCCLSKGLPSRNRCWRLWVFLKTYAEEPLELESRKYLFQLLKQTAGKARPRICSAQISNGFPGRRLGLVSKLSRLL